MSRVLGFKTDHPVNWQLGRWRDATTHVPLERRAAGLGDLYRLESSLWNWIDP